MSEELVAVSKASAPVAQGDYEAICAALMQSERGRWFLQEYAQRNRSADTRLLLDAIGRIEAVVCAEQQRGAQQSLRSDLLEMAEAITRTRAEVAEIRPDVTPASTASAAAAPPSGPPGPRTGEVFAAAERIRDVTWAMRGHGFDPATCEQLEELAASILSASALRDPADHRASKLAEVLQYLERRIGSLLESCEEAEAAQRAPSEAREAEACTPVAEPAIHRNGSAMTFVAPILEEDAAEIAVAAPIRIPILPVAVHDDLEGDGDPSSAHEASASVAVPAAPLIGGTELLQSTPAEPTITFAPAVEAGEPAAECAAETYPPPLPMPEAHTGSAFPPERVEPHRQADGDPRAGAVAPEAPSPIAPPVDVYAEPSFPGADSRGFETVAAAQPLPCQSSGPERAAAEARACENADVSRADLQPPGAAPLARAKCQPAAPSPTEDPLAALKAMSPEELIALFS